MVALNFNSNGIQPSYGGDPGLPDGTYKTVLVSSNKVDVERMGQVVGAYLELKHAVIDGPLKGQTMVDRLNLQHTNPQTVEIANKQLSAYCHALGVFAFADTQQLHNIPMQIEVGRQIDKNTKQPLAFGEIKKIFDQNGNAPGKQGGGNAQQYQPNNGPGPNDPPPAGVHAQGGGWNNGGQNGNVGNQNGAGGFDQNNNGGGQNNGNAGGFNQNGNNGGAGGFDPNQGGNNQGQNGGGANWGGNAGGGSNNGNNGGGFDQSQNQGNNGGGGNWQPNNGGGAGGAPSWGAR